MTNTVEETPKTQGRSRKRSLRLVEASDSVSKAPRVEQEKPSADEPHESIPTDENRNLLDRHEESSDFLCNLYFENVSEKHGPSPSEPKELSEQMLAKIETTMGECQALMTRRISEITGSLGVSSLMEFYEQSPEIQFVTNSNALIRRLSSKEDRETVFKLQNLFSKAVPFQNLRLAQAMRNLLRFNVMMNKLSQISYDASLFVEWFGPNCDPRFPVVNLSHDTPNDAWSGQLDTREIWKELLKIFSSYVPSESTDVK